MVPGKRVSGAALGGSGARSWRVRRTWDGTSGLCVSGRKPGGADRPAFIAAAAPIASHFREACGAAHSKVPQVSRAAPIRERRGGWLGAAGAGAGDSLADWGAGNMKGKVFVKFCLLSPSPPPPIVAVRKPPPPPPPMKTPSLRAPLARCIAYRACA